MDLYIEIENGMPKSHPAYEENLIQAFGQVPSHWELFVRVEQPHPTPYQIFNSENLSYQKVNGVWTDVWDIREMTADEKNAKQQEVKDNWAAGPNSEIYADWFFDDEICAYRPPAL